MKYWLIIIFTTTHGNYYGKREILYNDEVACYTAMDYIIPPRKYLTMQMECISEVEHSIRK